MSLHTKLILAATILANFAVSGMGWISVDPNVLPTFAVDLVPFAFFGWAAVALSYAADLLTGQAD